MTEVLNDLIILIESFKEYLKKPKNMFIVNEIRINCKRLRKILEKVK